MTAVDTNVLVRFLTGDDPTQEAATRLLFASESIWIAKTVLLETARVLTSSYKFEERAIATALAGLLGLAKVPVEGAKSVASALALTGAGLEFADALDLAGRPDEVEFVSFDKEIVRRGIAARGETGSLAVAAL